MNESWRFKTYYEPRVLIETSRVLYPQFNDSVLCITGAELELLRNLMQYLHRRSTFASEYQKAGYLAPSNAEWDSITAIVANLQEKLMGCEEFLLLLEGILEQVTCICQQSTQIAGTVGNLPFYGPSLQPVIDDYLVGGGVIIEDTTGGETVIDIHRCSIAQLTFWAAYEITTEIFQPVGAEAVDVLLPMVMVGLAVMCGTSVLGIPIGILLALLWSLIKVDVAGSLEDVRNAILANERELTCAVYLGLWTDYSAASARAKAVISDMSGLSVLDKVALKLLFEPFVIYLAALAYASATPWALANVTPGACDCCETTEGSDWYAVELDPEDNTIVMGVDRCWQGTVPAGQTMAGLIWKVEVLQGTDLLLKCMSNPEAGCTGCSHWPNTSSHCPVGTYFSYKVFHFNNAECKSMLCPDATDHPVPDTSLCGPGDVGAGFLFFGEDKYAEVRFTHMIFKGSAPPCP